MHASSESAELRPLLCVLHGGQAMSPEAAEAVNTARTALYQRIHANEEIRPAQCNRYRIEGPMCWYLYDAAIHAECPECASSGTETKLSERLQRFGEERALTEYVDAVHLKVARIPNRFP